MNQEILIKLKLYIGMFKEYLGMEDYSERCIKDYPWELTFFIDYLQKTDIEDLNGITRDNILNYQAYLYSEYKTASGKPLALGSQASRLGAVKCFFRFLVKKGYFMYDPASAIDLPKSARSLPRNIMTKQEVNKLLNQPNVDKPKGLRDKAILELLYSTGIRNTELRNLMVYDVDTGNLEVRINQGKGRKDRIVPLGEVAAKYIEAYLKTARQYFMERRKIFLLSRTKESNEKLERENNLLFFGGRGRKFHLWSLDLLVKRYVKKAKINKYVTPHAIRHTFATHLLKEHAGIRHIQEMLGHSKLETTQLYTHLDICDLKREHRKCHPREQIK